MVGQEWLSTWTHLGITAQGLVSSRGADVPHAPHTPQKTMPPWPNRSSSNRSASPRRPKGSSSLLLTSETFLDACCPTSSFHLSSCRSNKVEQSSVKHCHLRRLLAPPHHGRCHVSPDLLLSTWPATLKQLTPSLLPRFPVGWCAQWKELALWLRKDGCQVSFDDVASRVEARRAVQVRFLRCEVVSRQSRDTNLKESTGQVTIDASPCCLRPSHGGEEVLRIDSDHVQASGSDCLRQHNQRHELDTLHRLSALEVGQCGLLFRTAFCFRQGMLHTTRRSLAPFGCTCRPIHQGSRCQASTSSLQTQKG